MESLMKMIGIGKIYRIVCPVSRCIGIAVKEPFDLE
jgi:hypothetical protein